MTTETWAGPSPAIAGSLRRVWRCAGVPVNGAAGTYYNNCEPGDLLIDTTNKTLYQNTNTAASPTWTQITAGGVTLDQAYDFGAAGAGRAIVADTGAVTITNSDVDTTNILEINKTPSGSAAGAGIVITMGGNATGAGISFANTGGGADISGTGALWTISKAGAAVVATLSSTAHTLLEGTAPAATICYVVRDNTGDVTVNAITGKQVHVAVAGVDVVDIAGTGLTVTGTLTVTSTGSILALSLGEGTAPAATVCYIVRDNTGDTTINALTGKAVHLAVANVDVLDVAGTGVTVTGTLHVTGVATFDVGWTFGGTITANAGIDLNGSYIILDADGNSRIDVTSGDVMDLELAGNSEYTFTTTALDMAANALDNAGFVILNGATAPAATEVYVVNDNTGDLTLNAVTGKTVNIAIANVDVARFAAASLTFVASVNIAGFATGAITINSGGADVDFSVAGDNNANVIVLDAGTDSLALGSAVTAGAFLTISGSAVNRAFVTSVAYGLHQPAATFNATNGASTLAAVARNYIGIPTLTSNEAMTYTVASTLVIAGPPTNGGGGNVTIGTAYALNVLAGNSHFGGSVNVNGTISTTSGGLSITALAGQNLIITAPANTTGVWTTDNIAHNSSTSAGVFWIRGGAAAAGSGGAIALYGKANVGSAGVIQLATPNAALANDVTRIEISGASAQGGGSVICYEPLDLRGNLNMNNAAYDLVTKAATAAALEISDGTTKFIALDTRVTTVAVTTLALDISDYTLASAAGAVATGLSLAAHTLNWTGNTQVTTQVDTVVIGARTLAGDTATLTVDEANTLLLVAPLEGANVAITAASALRVVNAGGTPLNQYGIYIEDLTVGATADYGIWIAGADTAAIYVASGDPIHLGVAGASTGKIEMDGATSGTCTIVPAAATTSWTLTLPAVANTDAGYQLTCAGANSITSWAAAASVREAKDIFGLHTPQDALDKILGTRVYDFHYKAGMGTQDAETDYVGVVADEAPWAMHYGGGVVNPINALGYTVLAFQAMDAKIKELEADLVALKGGK